MKKLFICILPGLLYGCSTSPGNQMYQVIQWPKGLAGEWFKISEGEGEFIIYNPCDGANNTIHMDSTFLVISEGQDATSFSVLNVEENESGTMRFRLLNDSSGDTTFHYFDYHDQSKGLAFWAFDEKNLGSMNNLFISGTKKELLKEFNQPCEECYDNCDELLTDEMEMDDGCIFDLSTQTDGFLQGIGEFENYTWNDSSKTATILLDVGDTVKILHGGCTSFNFYVTLILTASDSLSLDQPEQGVDRLFQLAGKVFTAQDFQMMDSLYTYQMYSVYDTDGMEYDFHQELYCQMSLQIIRRDDGLLEFTLGYYIC